MSVLAEWIQKLGSNSLLSTKTHLRFKYRNRLKVKEQSKIFHANSNQKRDTQHRH